MHSEILDLRIHLESYPISDATNTAGLGRARPHVAQSHAPDLFTETKKEPTVAEGLFGVDYGQDLSVSAHFDKASFIEDCVVPYSADLHGLIEYLSYKSDKWRS